MSPCVQSPGHPVAGGFQCPHRITIICGCRSLGRVMSQGGWEPDLCLGAHRLTESSLVLSLRDLAGDAWLTGAGLMPSWLEGRWPGP